LSTGRVQPLSGYSGLTASGADAPEEIYSVSWKYVCFGKALAGLAECRDLVIAEPPNAETLELLDTAFDVISRSRPGFGPEDFTLFTFSLVQGCCNSDAERTALGLAASKYLIQNAPRLSPEFAALELRAREMLASSGPKTAWPAVEARTRDVAGSAAPNAASPTRTASRRTDDLRKRRGSGHRQSHMGWRADRSRRVGLVALAFFVCAFAVSELVPIFG